MNKNFSVKVYMKDIWTEIIGSSPYSAVLYSARPKSLSPFLSSATLAPFTILLRFANWTLGIDFLLIGLEDYSGAGFVLGIHSWIALQLKFIFLEYISMLYILYSSNYLCALSKPLNWFLNQPV